MKVNGSGKSFELAVGIGRPFMKIDDLSPIEMVVPFIVITSPVVKITVLLPIEAGRPLAVLVVGAVELGVYVVPED